MNVISNKLTYSYIYTFVIYILICVYVLSNSLLNIHGYLSPDSTNYLALAQNLINNGSFYLNYYGMEDEWFAVWPVGYPTMIFLIAKATGASVFLASKLLNILIIGIIFVFLNTIYKENGFVFASIFLLFPFLEVFSFTWSEAPFILGILLFSLSLYHYIRAEKINYKMLLSIIITAIFMFLMRYIGVFSVAALGLAFIYLVYFKKFQKAFLLVIPILSISTFSILYLYNNYLLTGYQTGIERVPAQESYFELIKMTIAAFLVEINLFTNDITFIFSDVVGIYFGYFGFFLVLFLQLYFFYRVFKKHLIYNTFSISNGFSMWKVFLAVGVLYYSAIIFMRWTSHFDALNYRLLIPGTFLILISFISISKELLSSKGFFRFRLGFVVIAILSFSIFTFKPYLKTILLGTEIETYSSFVDALNNEAESIPSKSVIVMGSIHLNYLRTDLINIQPDLVRNYPIDNVNSLADEESWDDFTSTFIDSYPGKEIYLYVQNKDHKDAILKNYYNNTIDVNHSERLIKLN